eukprot:CAMPEP_0197519018 /NCGR_PEP_ID=MMETSP1318-20131121/4270_1 /TAXON_ID=552666 /ORGANISM="Partenskyella glossopodia, Strain RCC365" /LENGTH=306 /DNA_ID=CAMNT_0043069765 /DNA_START=143 /DNA_END=1063 /DNA_ORIENTATION=+
MKAVRLTVEDAKGSKSYADVALFGAHVLKFVQVGADNKELPLLWVSKNAKLDGSRAIRGGIPVIFPQFSGLGSMKAHGFARTSMWEVHGISSDLSTPAITATFRLTENKLSNEMWGEDKKFIFDYIVTLAGATEGKSSSLKIETKITNQGQAPIGFHCALHTYFPISDISKAAVTAAPSESLSGLDYIDQLKDAKTRAEKVVKQTSDEILFDKETDRIYLNVPKVMQVVDKKSGIAIVQESDFTDAVVWNPWIEKSKRMAAKDFGEEEYKEMLCVEAAEVGKAGDAVTLKPGAIFQKSIVLSSKTV